MAGLLATLCFIFVSFFGLSTTGYELWALVFDLGVVF